jgi:hypothetical protein
MAELFATCDGLHDLADAVAVRPGGFLASLFLMAGKVSDLRLADGSVTTLVDQCDQTRAGATHLNARSELSFQVTARHVAPHAPVEAAPP